MNGEETLVMVTCVLCLIACSVLALVIIKDES